MMLVSYCVQEVSIFCERRKLIWGIWLTRGKTGKRKRSSLCGSAEMTATQTHTGATAMASLMRTPAPAMNPAFQQPGHVK